MADIILDCYTDEPSGLGVPPYLGTYPRYLAGRLEDPYYLTIDDLRSFFSDKRYDINKAQKTNIKIYNLTKNINNTREIIQQANNLYVILGVHTPGKYLSSVPGTLRELSEIIKNLRSINKKIKTILTGPAVYGTQLEGGKFFEKTKDNLFDNIQNLDFSYDEISRYATKGAKILKQIDDLRIIEIETGHGCNSGKCSFCTEPLKHKLEFRNPEDILDETEAFYNLGARHFRLGKQSCFYSYPKPIGLLKTINEKFPEIKTLHIDNVNPVKVVNDKNHEITKAIAKYCSPGNIAAFGVESFDKEVVKENCLNCTPETAFNAVEILNKYGAERADNGMHKFLPGINILLGLKGESKKTHQANMHWLQKIMDSNLLVRRINIRQVSIFQGTPLFKDCKNKFLKKNKKYYWKWRNEIRQKVDFPMLQKLVPKGTILKDIRTEIYDGNTTFGRQLGTYPLIVGIKGRLGLKRFYNVKIVDHMLRSVTGEVIQSTS